MKDVERFAGSVTRFALLALTFFPVAASAAPQKQADCKPYEQQEKTLLAAQKALDPSIRTASLDTVFYSAKLNSCLASIFFTKRHSTYGCVFDIAEDRMLWTKSYRGINFTPARIVAMDEDMDEEIESLEFLTPDSANERAANPLGVLFDRTMNTFPEIKSALTDSR